MDLITINDNTSSVVCEQIVTKRELSVGSTALKSPSTVNPIVIDAPTEITGNLTIGESSVVILGDLDGTNISGLIGGWTIPASYDTAFGEFDQTSGLLISQPFTASAGVPNRFIGDGSQSWGSSPVSKELVNIVRPPPNASEKFYLARHNTSTTRTILIEKTGEFSTLEGVGTPGPLQTITGLGNGGDGESIAFRPDTNELMHFSGKNQGNQFMESINPDTLVIGPNLFPGADVGFNGAVTASAWDPVRGVWFVQYESTIRTIPENGVIAGINFVGTTPSSCGGMDFTGTRLFTAAKSNTSLYEIDPDTGMVLATIVMTSPLGTVQGCNGMAYDRVNDILYVIYRVLGIRRLGVLNTATGAITNVVNFSNFMAGIAFDNMGQLWIVSGDGGSPRTTLYRIDGIIHFNNITINNKPGIGWDAANSRWLVAWNTMLTPSGIHIFAMDGATLAVTDLTDTSAGSVGNVCAVVIANTRVFVFLDGQLSIHEYDINGENVANGVTWTGDFIFEGSEDFLPVYGNTVQPVFKAATFDPSGKVWVVIEFLDDGSATGGTLLGYMNVSEIPANLTPFNTDIHVTTHMPKKRLSSLSWMA